MPGTDSDARWPQPFVGKPFGLPDPFVDGVAAVLGEPNDHGIGVGPIGEAEMRVGSGIDAPETGLGEPFDIDVERGRPRAGGRFGMGFEGDSIGGDDSVLSGPPFTLISVSCDDSGGS